MCAMSSALNLGILEGFPTSGGIGSSGKSPILHMLNWLVIPIVVKRRTIYAITWYQWCDQDSKGTQAQHDL